MKIMPIWLPGYSTALLSPRTIRGPIAHENCTPVNPTRGSLVHSDKQNELHKISIMLSSRKFMYLSTYCSYRIMLLDHLTNMSSNPLKNMSSNPLNKNGIIGLTDWQLLVKKDASAGWPQFFPCRCERAPICPKFTRTDGNCAAVVFLLLPPPAPPAPSPPSAHIFHLLHIFPTSKPYLKAFHYENDLQFLNGDESSSRMSPGSWT